MIGLRKEVLSSRWVWPRIALRTVATVVVASALMSWSRQAAIAVNAERNRVITRWIAVPELCETTEGVWKRCPWTRR